MKIAIAGGTGLVGMALTAELTSKGHQVLILTRKEREDISPASQIKYVQWLSGNANPESELEGIDAFVNLAGATINNKWTDDYKRKILESRLQAASEVMRILTVLRKKPEVLVNASAVGYYGTSLTATFTEESVPVENDFLTDTTHQWEQAALKAQEIGVRVVLCRLGVVLARSGGALPRMTMPYRFFAGGTVGSGRQWLSWIHINDVVSGILFAIENTTVVGPVNFTAPEPVSMEQFGKVLSRVLEKPHWLPVPSFMLKLLLGEMSLLVLKGQRVLPQKLESSGFSFQYPTLSSALKNIFEN